MKEQLESSGIEIYEFPTFDASIADRNKKMNGLIPFAAVAGNSTEQVNGKMIRVRKLPWGMVKGKNANER